MTAIQFQKNCHTISFSRGSSRDVVVGSVRLSAKRTDTFGSDYNMPLFKYIPLYSLGYSIGQSRAAQAHSAPKKQQMMKERSRKKTYAWIMVSRTQCKIIVIIIRAYVCACGCVRCVCVCVRERENVCSFRIEVAAHAHLRVWAFSIFEMIVTWEWVSQTPTNECIVMLFVTIIALLLLPCCLTIASCGLCSWKPNAAVVLWPIRATYTRFLHTYIFRENAIATNSIRNERRREEIKLKKTCKRKIHWWKIVLKFLQLKKITEKREANEEKKETCTHNAQCS